MGSFRVLAVSVIGLGACGSSGVSPRQLALTAQPAAEPVAEPAAEPTAEPVPTCVDVGMRFLVWLHGEFSGNELPVPDQMVTDAMRGACIVAHWTVENRQCMDRAVTHDDWSRCFSTVPNSQPMPPKYVAPWLLEGKKISGDRNIVPDDDTKGAIQRSNRDRLKGSFKLCINEEGLITHITMLKSTGFSAYDVKIQREMSNWHYSPYTWNGMAVPMCTVATFIYSQR